MRAGVLRRGFAVAVPFLLSLFATRSASAQEVNVPQQVINNTVQNIIQTVRDQIQKRRVVAPPGMLRFSGEESDFDRRDPFASRGVSNPFGALAYAKDPYVKAPALAAPPPAAWLYGANLVGSGDRAQASGVEVSVATMTGAVDVTRIGIFTATDALTFIATGSHSWAHTFTTGGVTTDGSIPSTSGTLSYLNGGFSTDFTALASWTRNTSSVALVAPADGSSMAYTWNGQYRFDFPYTVWMEPTVGLTYSESYTANFGTKAGDSTEFHGGMRVGFEADLLGFKIQPSISGQYYRIVDASGAGAVGGAVPVAAGVIGTNGLRGSAKVNVLWTPQLSSYLEVHGSSITVPNPLLPGVGGLGTSIAGTQAGLRYTW
jgi:hypothetical protein